jgi:hypothetical protein
MPSDDLLPSLLTISDVLGTGWFAADGAVGLLGILSAKQMGATRIIAMSRHEQRRKLAREFGATTPESWCGSSPWKFRDARSARAARSRTTATTIVTSAICHGRATECGSGCGRADSDATTFGARGESSPNRSRA